MNITGTPLNETLTGGLSSDLIQGLGGDDVLQGLAGGDLLYGGDGADSMTGGDGNDVVDGGAGNDTATGDAGDDFLAGGAGDDVLDGGAGLDTLYGGAGNDQLLGSEVGYGGDGADFVTGGAGADTLYGGYGNDTLIGGGGGDVLDGGPGFDTVDFGASTAAIRYVANGAPPFSSGDIAGDALTGVERLVATVFADTLTGSSGLVIELFGGAGNDSITGWTSSPLVSGDDGDDTLTGGSLLYGGAGNDVLTVSGVGEGGDGNDTISGGSGADSMYGGAGDDRLLGSAGNDVMDGGAGTDTVAYTGAISGFDFYSTGTAIVVAGQGTDVLHDVEQVSFASGAILSIPGLTLLSASIADATASEGVSGGILTFTVSLSRATLLPVTIDYSTVSGSALAGVDFTGVSGTLTFAVGQTSKTISVALTNDVAVEPSESFTVQLSNAVNATLGDAVATATIVDDEAAQSLTGTADADNLAGTGGPDTLDGGAGADTLSGGLGNDMLIGGADDDSLLAGGGADTLIGGDGNDRLVLTAVPDAGAVFDGGAGQDSLVVSGVSAPLTLDFITGIESVLFRTGASAYDVTLADAATAPNSTLSVGFDGTTGAGIRLSFDGSAESDGQLGIVGGLAGDTLKGGALQDSLYGGGGNDVLAGNGDADRLYGGDSIDRLTGGVGDDLIDGGAGDDYAIYAGNRAGYQIVADGDGPLVVIDTDLSNGDEGRDILTGVETLRFADQDFQVVLPQTVEPPGPDDGSAPIVDVSSPTAHENDGALSFRVFLDHPTSSIVTVRYQTQEGGGANAGDYVAVSGTLVFLPGETSKTVDVTLIDNDVFESTESIRLNLNTPSSNALVGSNNGVGTILDDDFGVPALSVGATSATEGNSGTAAMIFTVTLSQAAAEDVTVTYATADGTALAGADYVASSGFLIFAPGETSKTVSVSILADLANEAGETVLLQLGTPSGATVAQGTGAGTILNDDPAVAATAGNDMLYGVATGETLLGGAGADFADGAGGNDLIAGGVADDTLQGGDGDDTLDGGAGTDWLYGGSGTDQVSGGDGDDYYMVTDANDSVIENLGNGFDRADVMTNQFVTVGSNVELIEGLAAGVLGLVGEPMKGVNILAQGGDHRMNGYDFADTLSGGGGNDLLYGGGSTDSLDGGTGNDQAFGGAGNDKLQGNDGNDLLDGGVGLDTMTGGGGDDYYYIDNVGDQVVELSGEGFDRVDVITSGAVIVSDYVEWIEGLAQGNVNITAGLGNQVMWAYGGDDTLAGESGDDVLFGGREQDWLYGGAGNDALWGEAGSDHLFGGAGNDALYGSDGLSSSTEDTMTGGEGDDYYVVNDNGDVVIEFAGEGFDRVDVVTNSLTNVGDHVEWIEGLAAGANITAGAGSQRMWGYVGSNTLRGGADDDWLDGGAADDVLFGGTGADTFAFHSLATTEVDQIGDFDVAGGDLVDLKAMGVTSLAELGIVQAAGGTIIQLSTGFNLVLVDTDTVVSLQNGARIVMHGVDDAALTADDFLFA